MALVLKSCGSLIMMMIRMIRMMIRMIRMMIRMMIRLMVAGGAAQVTVEVISCCVLVDDCLGEWNIVR